MEQREQFQTLIAEGQLLAWTSLQASLYAADMMAYSSSVAVVICRALWLQLSSFQREVQSMVEDLLFDRLQLFAENTNKSFQSQSVIPGNHYPGLKSWGNWRAFIADPPLQYFSRINFPYIHIPDSFLDYCLFHLNQTPPPLFGSGCFFPYLRVSALAFYIDRSKSFWKSLHCRQIYVCHYFYPEAIRVDFGTYYHLL